MSGVSGVDKLAEVARAMRVRVAKSSAALQAEFRAGQAGDDSPPTPLWAGPRQQLDALLAALGAARSNAPSPPSDDEEAMLDAVSRVDWDAVRAATGERTAEVTSTLRDLAGKVDWQRLQPVAAEVSSALIAALAAGRLPVGGPIGGQVIRAIVNQGDLADKVSATMASQHTPVPADFRTVIDVTATG
jgi:hypothetical protein